MAEGSQWILLAHILRPQGRRGEVLADLFTDFPERFDGHPQVWLAAEGFAGASADASGLVSRDSLEEILPAQPAKVLSHWLPMGRNAGRIVLHFAGVDSIEQAETLSGKEVVVPMSERLPLDAGAAYISDLIGATVYDRGKALGVVEDVQFATSSDGAHRLEDAAPLLAVLTPERDEVLVPFANAFIVEIDLASKSIRMALPEGLAEINLPSKVRANRSAGE
jgi:16S rRNA processing protein RimM